MKIFATKKAPGKRLTYPGQNERGGFGSRLGKGGKTQPTYMIKRELAHILGVDEKTLRHWEMDRHAPLKRHLIILQKYLKALEH